MFSFGIPPSARRDDDDESSSDHPAPPGNYDRFTDPGEMEEDAAADDDDDDDLEVNWADTSSTGPAPPGDYDRFTNLGDDAAAAAAAVDPGANVQPAAADATRGKRKKARGSKHRASPTRRSPRTNSGAFGRTRANRNARQSDAAPTDMDVDEHTGLTDADSTLSASVVLSTADSPSVISGDQNTATSHSAQNAAPTSHAERISRGSGMSAIPENRRSRLSHSTSAAQNTQREDWRTRTSQQTAPYSQTTASDNQRSRLSHSSASALQNTSRNDRRPRLSQNAELYSPTTAVNPFDRAQLWARDQAIRQGGNVAPLDTEGPIGTYERQRAVPGGFVTTTEPDYNGKALTPADLQFTTTSFLATRVAGASYLPTVALDIGDVTTTDGYLSVRGDVGLFPFPLLHVSHPLRLFLAEALKKKNRTGVLWSRIKFLAGNDIYECVNFLKPCPSIAAHLQKYSLDKSDRYLRSLFLLALAESDTTASLATIQMYRGMLNMAG